MVHIHGVQMSFVPTAFLADAVSEWRLLLPASEQELVVY